MKRTFHFLILTLALFSAVLVQAQVTNFTVNGSSTSFSMASGDAVSWEYDIPSGQGAIGEIWFDLNDNGIIEPGTDKALFLFVQTDGDTNGNGGPPDMDGTANGHVVFGMPVGLAPAKYILRFAHNSVGMSIGGTVTPLASPNATISGTVTPPPGKDKRNILVEADQVSDSTGQGNNDNSMFWNALTDSNGFYTINMHVDSSTTYWRVEVQDNFAPSIPNPTDIVVTLSGAASGADFGYVAAAAQVSGTVLDENLLPIPFTDVYVSGDTGFFYRGSMTDAAGFFQIGLAAGDLVVQSWRLQTSQNGNTTSTVLQAVRELPAINPGDSLYRTLVVYTVNSQIEGYVRIDGAPPAFSMGIVAESQDSARANTMSDASTGHFVIPVSDKLSEYRIWTWDMLFNASVDPLFAQAGDTGKILTITTLSVIERGTGMPSAFRLHQNYPNPFNPATGIRYDVPSLSHVTLTVYDMLGQEVAKLMDGEQLPGSYTARFDASELTSGVYFYRLSAGAYVATEKMILMK